MKPESVLQTKYDRKQYTLENPKIWKKLSLIKGKPFINYRNLLKKAEKGEILTDFPIEVLIKTTLNCNHFCPKCLHGMSVFPHGKKYFMSFETLKKVLDEGEAKGLQSVVFTGGEPTLHPQIIEFIKYAGQKKFPDISFITNGALLTEKVIDCILENGVTRLNISLDAVTPETYKKVHGVDDYTRVLNNIDHLLEKRNRIGNQLPLLSISFVLSEENAHELDKFIELWHKKADGGIKIYPYKNVFSVVDDDFSKTYGAGKYRPTDLSPDSLPTNVAHSKPIMKGYSIKCTIPWYRCHVGINGELQACTTQGFCDHPQMVMGNIHEITFEEAWKSEKWSLLRQITLARQYEKHPICSICQKSV